MKHTGIATRTDIARDNRRSGAQSSVGGHLVAALCLVPIVVACGDGGSRDDRGGGPGPALDTLRAELFLTAPIMGRPAGLAVEGSRLWVRDAAGDPELHVIDAGSGAVLASLGRRGEGAGEFRGAAGSGQVLKGDTAAIWVFDPGGQRALRVAYGIPSSDWRSVNLQIPPYVARLIWTGTSTIVGVTTSEDSRLVFFDTGGKRTHTVASPLPGPQDVPAGERMKAAIAAFGMCARPGGFVFVQYYRLFGRIEMFRRDGYEMTRVDVPFPSEPLFGPDEEGVMRFTPNRIHYLDCAAAESRFYMIYSGAPIDPAARSDAGSHLHLFDWEGRLEKTVHLDTPMTAIAVDEAGGWLYGASSEEGSIFRFRLTEGF